MKTIKKIGRELSVLGFGGASIGADGGGYSFGSVSDAQSQKLIEFALDAGINVFDFAPIYGFGLAEKRAGQALKRSREKAFLISKCGVSWHANKRVNMGNNPETCVKMLEQSLRDFQTDYVDLYMVHWPDPRIDIRYSLEPLAKAQAQGKILHLGLCNTTAEDLQRSRDVCKIEAVQMEVNLFNQDSFLALENELDDEVYRMGWGTYDKGILAGSVKKNRSFEKNDCRSWAPWWKKSNWKKKVDFVEEYLLKNNINEGDLSCVSLRTSLEIVDTALCGAKNIAQITKNVESLEREFDPQKAKDDFATF